MMNDLLSKVIDQIEKMNPAVGGVFKRKPWLLPIAIAVLALLLVLLVFVCLKVVAAIFGFTLAYSRYIVAFLIISIIFAVVHGLAESLAKLFLLILIIAGTGVAVVNSRDWGDLVISCLLIGALVGLLTLPLHSFIWKDIDKPPL